MSSLQIYPCVVCKVGKCSPSCCFSKVLPKDPINGEKNMQTADMLFSLYPKKVIKSYLSDVEDSQKAAVIENLLLEKEGRITNAAANLSELDSLEEKARQADSEIASLEKSMVSLQAVIASVDATRVRHEGRYERHENAKSLAKATLDYLDEKLPVGVFVYQDYATKVAETLQIYDEQVSALDQQFPVQPQPGLILPQQQQLPVQPVQPQPSLILPQQQQLPVQPVQPQPSLILPQQQQLQEGPPPKKSKN